MQEKENILRILKETKEAIIKKNYFLIKRLSDQTIHTSSIYQDTDNIAIAVIVYALSKIFERERYKTYKDWQFFNKELLKNLDNLIESIKKEKISEIEKDLTNIRKIVDKLSGHFKVYVEEIFRKARINKASRIYEHGISMQQTADILGITLFELAEYAGKTGIADVNLSITKNIKERIKDAEEIFS